MILGRSWINLCRHGGLISWSLWVYLLQTPIEQVQNQTRNLMLNMKKMRDAMTDLAERNRAMEKLLRDMAVKPKPEDPTTEEAEQSKTFI